MKKIAVALLLLLIVPVGAQALTTKDILSLVAMPLAVATVSDLNGVPQNDFANILANLNQANVPPTEFVQVVRYVPVALVRQPNTFVQFVDDRTAQGIAGPQLVDIIDQNLTTNYGVTPVVDPNAPVVFVDDSSSIPQPVIAQLGTSNLDPVQLALMPLAVAAVADAANIPQDQLTDLVSTLNQANVPPQQFIQVVQYAPVAVTTPAAPQPFVPFVRTQVARGITGPALVATIDQSYGYRGMRGGPPGQIKKIEGLQTGAEVVHGSKPGRQFVVSEAPPPQRIIVERPQHFERDVEHEHGNPHGIAPGQAKRMMLPPPMASSAPPVIVQRPVPQPQPQPQFIPPGQAKKEEGGNPGEGHGHGNGKGHGKD